MPTTACETPAVDEALPEPPEAAPCREEGAARVAPGFWASWALALSNPRRARESELLDEREPARTELSDAEPAAKGPEIK